MKNPLTSISATDAHTQAKNFVSTPSHMVRRYSGERLDMATGRKTRYAKNIPPIHTVKPRMWRNLEKIMAFVVAFIGGRFTASQCRSQRSISPVRTKNVHFA